ncbi:flagellar protein FlgN [Rhodanobacter sp. MP1X3]|jgi:flagellar biosynthesis protein FlgN|uniref:flagella synthesis protein FlgN n=1 Tax=Rhodanobacter sp. MP1X3 TaxID=2723086 RepID=UPI00161EF308|nr:flagellar protein FlgN [Rhodanobacter sp. MP1X3]MBB6240860.1 flagella synthesis protein FlgN [Rhodanobacter sp. MP1X3]
MIAPLQAELDDALRAIVDDMSAATTQLILVLDEEREALNRADANALNRAGEAKQMLMRRLEQLDAERLHMSSSSAHATQAVQPAWSALLKTLTTCRDKNQRNGALVGQRLSQVRRALSVLTGNGNESSVYSHSGTLQAGHRSLPLAEA